MIVTENSVLIDFDFEKHEIEKIKSITTLRRAEHELLEYLEFIGVDNRFTILSGVGFFSVSMWFDIANHYPDSVAEMGKVISGFLLFLSMFNHMPALYQGDPTRAYRDDYSVRLRNNKYLCNSSYGYKFIIEKGE